MRLLIADDHDLLRDALKAFLDNDGRFQVEVASSVAGALNVIEKCHGFDLVLLDLNMPGMNGLQGLKQVIDANVNGQVALLSGLVPEGTAKAALRVGAVAVLPKTLSIERLVDSILAIVAGDFKLSPSTSAESKQSRDLPQLTTRQLQVLRCICEGQSNKEIARTLNLQEPTVKMHIKMIFMKFQISSRTQAIIIANRLNLV